MYELNKAVINKGRAAQVAVCLIDTLSGANLFTCGMTSTVIRIENQDGTFIEKVAATGLSWGLPDPTTLHVYEFSADETALMKTGVDRSVWVKVIFGANFMKYEMKKFLTVQDDAF